MILRILEATILLAMIALCANAPTLPMWIIAPLWILGATFLYCCEKRTKEERKMFRKTLRQMAERPGEEG